MNCVSWSFKIPFTFVKDGPVFLMLIKISKEALQLLSCHQENLNGSSLMMAATYFLIFSLR